MSENNNPERTFTQAEVNQIVSDRLKSEREKIMRDANRRQSELDRRETLLNVKYDWTRRGLPAELLDSIDVSRDGALEAAERIVTGIMPSTNRGGFGGKQDLSDGTGDDDSAMRNAFGLNRK